MINWNCLSRDSTVASQLADVEYLSLRGCRETCDSLEDGSYIEADDDDPQFYALYGRDQYGDDKALHDFSAQVSQVSAMLTAQRIACLFRLPLRVYTSEGHVLETNPPTDGVAPDARLS